jgi:hypothetical protein
MVIPASRVQSFGYGWYEGYHPKIREYGNDRGGGFISFFVVLFLYIEFDMAVAGKEHLRSYI